MVREGPFMWFYKILGNVGLLAERSRGKGMSPQLLRRHSRKSLTRPINWGNDQTLPMRSTKFYCFCKLDIKQLGDFRDIHKPAPGTTTAPITESAQTTTVISPRPFTKVPTPA